MSKWKRQDGTEVDLSNADHQVLSNFIWLNVAILNKPLSSVWGFVEEISERFGNKILPYRPIPWFVAEIQTLINGGFIYLNDMGDTLIIVNKRIIGEILKHDHPSFIKYKEKKVT